jgi:hypothetical protein
MAGVGSLPKTRASSLWLSFPAQPAQDASSVSRTGLSFIAIESCHTYVLKDIARPIQIGIGFACPGVRYWMSGDVFWMQLTIDQIDVPRPVSDNQ